MMIEFNLPRSNIDTVIDSNIPLSISVGRRTYFGGGLKVNYYPPSASLRIGRFCSIADDVQYHFSGGHDPERISTYPDSYFYDDLNMIMDKVPKYGFHEEIDIGNDVWIGVSARIMAGVHIGDGAIIGAFSVVAKDVPPYSIVVGNPARVIRKRFSDEDINFLSGLRWWDLDDGNLVRLYPHLFSTDILALRRAVEAISPCLPQGIVRESRRFSLNISS